MLEQNYIIRKMNRKEFDLVIEWANQEGWNSGCYDAGSFIQPTQKDFL